MTAGYQGVMQAAEGPGMSARLSMSSEKKATTASKPESCTSIASSWRNVAPGTLRLASSSMPAEMSIPVTRMPASVS